MNTSTYLNLVQLNPISMQIQSMYDHVYDKSALTRKELQELKHHNKHIN